MARARVGRAPLVVVFAQAVHVVGAVAAALATTLFFEVPVGEARLRVALYLLLAFAPYAVLAPLIAPLLMRGRHAHGAAMVATDVGRAVLASLLVSHLGGALLYPLGFGLLVLSRVHSVSRNSLLPELLGPDDDLLEANSVVAVVSGPAALVGGAAALALAALVGPGAALLLATAAFATGSFAGLWLSPPRRLHKDAASPERGRWLGEGRMRRVAAALVAARAALGFTTMLVAFTFHDGADRTHLTVALGLLALGSGVAPLVVPFARWVVHGDLASVAVAALAVAALATLPLEGLVGTAALGAAVGFFAATARLAFDARVQDHVAEEARARAYARYETVLQLGWVGGAAAGSLFELSASSGGYVVAAIAASGLLLGRLVAR